MTSEALTGLINNTALLLALAVLYDTFPHKPQLFTRWMQVIAGVLIGVIGITVMLSPWELVTGVVFDTRSILLSISGLFFGGIPTLIAALMTSLFRLHEGGVGAWTGVAVITFSAGVGVLWGRRYQDKRQLPAGELYLFAVIVHAGMMILMLTLPNPIAQQVVGSLSLPILVIYPVGTVLLGMMFIRQLTRRETEESVRVSETRLRQIVQSMPVMLDAFDPNDMIIAWNSECERILGYSTAEMIGNPKAWEMFYPDPTYLAKMRQLCAVQGSNYYSQEWTMQCKDGTKKTIAWLNISNRVKIPGWASWGVGIDVTDRVRTMAALSEAEDRLRLALSAANVGLWDRDLRTGEVYYSPEWKRQLGYEADELTSQISEWESRLHPDDAARAIAEARNYVEEPAPKLESEFRLRHRNGSYRSILSQSSLLYHEDGNPVRMLGSHVDITERNQAEETLRASEAHLRAVVSSTSIVLMAVDRDGVITLLQGQGLGALGVEPTQWVGRSIFIAEDSVHDNLPMRLSVREAFARALADEEVDTTEVYGSLNFAIHYTPLRSKTGEVTGAISVATDVTQRLEAEKLRLQLEKEQEIVALRERFITIASHDFRTPLTVIKMAAHMLQTYF